MPQRLQEKKNRSLKSTFLIVGEGSHEVFFLKYLRHLYLREGIVWTKIIDGKGGTADGIVDYAGRILGDYHKRIVLLDNDKKKIEMSKARKKAVEKNINLIENTPCLESLLLSVLNNGESFENKRSRWCKKEFECKYLDKRSRQEICEFEKKISKSLLNKQRLIIPKLDKLISIFEGKY
ncbi:MAG: RloB domain-containing protein [Candidatus Paceibacterota bacterium]|jgi:hypothetical protein